jgi:hypothetical protein
MPNDIGGESKASEKPACFTELGYDISQLDGAMDTVLAPHRKEEVEPEFFGFGHPPED